MDKITMADLANKLNVSKTTVSKALNNCPGISPKTKHMIIEAASGCGYISKQTKRAECRVSVVLPSSPDYFWGSLRKKIDSCSKETNIKWSNYVYPDLFDGFGALHCINQALSEDISVLILAVPDLPEIRKKLEEVANDILIILVEEFIDIKNVFYVGENSFSQGYFIGERYIKAYPDSTRFALLHSTDFYTEKKRIEGFMAALNDYNKEMILDIIGNSETKSKSAHIARQLADLKVLPDCIFCPSGDILYAAGSVKKLNNNIHCIGFDLHTKTDSNIKYITDLFLQDIDSYAQKAWEYTEKFLNYSTFPECKKTYIANIIDKTLNRKNGIH